MSQFGEDMPSRTSGIATTHAGTADPLASSGGFDESMDDELARAIEASYRAQTDAGSAATEDDMLAEALRLSRLEEEKRQHRNSGMPIDEDDATVAAAMMHDSSPGGDVAGFNASMLGADL